LIQVVFSGALSTAVEDVESLSMDVSSIDELLRRLTLRFPKIEPLLESGIAVAINGEIYRDNWHVAIPKDAEVFLLPRIQGG